MIRVEVQRLTRADGQRQRSASIAIVVDRFDAHATGTSGAVDHADKALPAELVGCGRKVWHGDGSPSRELAYAVILGIRNVEIPIYVHRYAERPAELGALSRPAVAPGAKRSGADDR